MRSTEHYKIGSIRFSSFTDGEIVTAINETIESGGRISIAHANAHFVVEANDNPRFNEYIGKYQLVQPDGVGVYWAAKLLRVNNNMDKYVQTGTYFYYLLFDYANEKKKKMYFLGTTESVLTSLTAVVKKKYPGIIITGCHHGYFDLADQSIAQRINNSSPDILMVGMGVPRQETWLQDNYDKMNVPVCITVGAGLDFLSSLKRRAPELFRILGLEWFFRLLQEPRRLWKRYVIGIPKFVYIVLRQKFSE